MERKTYAFIFQHAQRVSVDESLQRCPDSGKPTIVRPHSQFHGLPGGAPLQSMQTREMQKRQRKQRVQDVNAASAHNSERAIGRDMEVGQKCSQLCRHLDGHRRFGKFNQRAIEIQEQRHPGKLLRLGL